MPPHGIYDQTMPRAVGAFFLLVLGFSVGCQAPPAATTPTQIALRIPDRDAFLDVALTVLREHDFSPQRVDRRTGLAVTHPTTGAQWFEFWRADSQGSYQLLESSLHTLRRIVTLRLEPLSEPAAASEPAAGEPAGASQPAEAEPGPGEYRLIVQVDKQRYSAPERQVTTASMALGIYSERLPTEEGLRRARSEGEHWVPLGRDVLLEAYLLDRIVDATDAEPVTEVTR